MYYEVYLDFYFLESFLTDVALLILVKTVMREKWKAKRIAGTAVLESMWSCIELLLLSGEFYSDLFLDRFRFASGNGRTWKKNGKRSALWCIVAWNFKLLLWRCTVCGRNVPIYSGNFCENGGISDPVDAFVSVYGNRPKQTADLRGQSLAVWEK